MAENTWIKLLLEAAKGASHIFGKKLAESSVNALVPHEPSAAAQYQKLMRQYAKHQINQQAMGQQLLELLGQWQTHAAQAKADELKLMWDKDNWFSKLDRQETMQILGQTRHRLLMLAACPEISPDCPESFLHNLKTEVRNGAGAWLHQYYPPDSGVCPVEFYGDYFKTPISDIDMRRLQLVLSAVPTAALSCELTDYEAHFHVGVWGMAAEQVTQCPLPAWNWEEAYQSLLADGMETRLAQRRVRQMIVRLHQLIAVYLADWYYLHLNPAYQPQLGDIAANGDAAAWAQPYIESARGMYAARQADYERAMRDADAEERRQAEAQSVGAEFSFEVVTVDKKGKIVTRETKTARQKVIDLGGGVTLDMVYIAGGTFTMGSPDSEKDRSSDEGPQRRVTIQPFYMGKYPVTQAQWQAVMGDNPSHFKGAKRPVENVSWNDCQEFVKRLNDPSLIPSPKLGEGRGGVFRLPSEAEWECACRAGTTTPFSFGETITPELANYEGNYAYGDGPKGEYRRQTTDAGSFPPNAFGLSDMHGNVWEWCQDTYVNNYKDAPTDGSAHGSFGDGKVKRGGSWSSDSDSCRSAYRFSCTPVLRSNRFGVRVVAVFVRT